MIVVYTFALFGGISGLFLIGCLAEDVHTALRALPNKVKDMTDDRDKCLKGWQDADAKLAAAKAELEALKAGGPYR